MKKFLITVILIFILISLSSSGFADRGSIPFTPGVNIFEPNQDALIAWNGKEEILILSTKLSASEKTKVLEVLPLPSEPEVKKSSREILQRANEFLITQVFNDLRQPVLRGEINKQPAAEVKEEVVIGSHDISVVKVLDKDHFVEWVNNYLQQKGENNPQIPADLSKNITNYINQGYNYFVFDTTDVGPEAKVNQAISYQFKTDKLYYPLEITRADQGVSEISLIILTDQNLINYKGISKNRIKDISSTKINQTETAYISEKIADLFFENKTESKNSSNRLKLSNWIIKDELANFKEDLLIDSNLAELLENQFSYAGTSYVDFKKDQNYPYQSQKEIEELAGKIEMRMGSRMYPWIAPGVKGKILFNAQTKKLIQNFSEEGKFVKLKGYSAKGSLNMRNPIDSMPHLIEIENAFFVTEVVGWTPYSGIALSEDGFLNNQRTRIWLEKE